VALPANASDGSQSVRRVKSARGARPVSMKQRSLALVWKRKSQTKTEDKSASKASAPASHQKWRERNTTNGLVPGSSPARPTKSSERRDPHPIFAGTGSRTKACDQRFPQKVTIMKSLGSLVSACAIVTSSAFAADGTSLGHGEGGRIVDFLPIIQQYNVSGELFRIQGVCKSACTMFLGIRSACVERSATLMFHGGHDIKENVTGPDTREPRCALSL
jgi:hypothetical protein